jgi:hypothetical protein
MFKARKLEKRRQETLSGIRYERWQLDAMIQRAQVAADPPNPAEIVSESVTRLSALEQRATTTTDMDDFAGIDGEAEEWGTFKAYICPRAEIEPEGNLSINLLEEWGVPKSRVEWMRNQLGSRLPNNEVQSARSALKMILMEENSWSSYTNDYEDTMKGYTYWLSGATFVLIVLAVVGLRFRLNALPLIFLGILLCGGAAGSCVSVMLKLPLLDVGLSSELDAYGRRILSRVATGTVASLVGCALFAVLMVSVQNLAFADIVTACTSPDAGPCSLGPCSIVKQLTLLALPILLGFSERTLTSVERRMLGDR